MFKAKAWLLELNPLKANLAVLDGHIVSVSQCGLSKMRVTAFYHGPVWAVLSVCDHIASVVQYWLS